jgi:tripartite-type tricarboxylate transporter receptor subunit TctC
VVAGKLRMLAIASSHRSDLAPNLPTIAELGVPGYEGVLWIGMMAPSGTPQGVIDRLAATAQAAAKDPALATRLRAQGVEPIGGTPAQFSDLITRELKQWRDLSKSAHITLQ